jgi:hypothetical protein
MVVSRDILGFSVAPNMGRVMEINGYFASIMRAEKQEKDSSGLPVGVPIPLMPVDYLKNRPNFWVGGQGSYVCPIESDWALWFNWMMNDHNISILTSIKGMNPITGNRINGYELEQYKQKCPIHDIEFKHGKFCTECNFKWPDQNYITDPDPYYLDGFRTADGSVRQFYFTEDMAKSVPELVIGKEDTVPAFGFCFYTLKHIPKVTYEKGNRLKNKFPVEEIQVRRSYSGGYFGYSGIGGVSGYSGISGAAGPTGTPGSVRFMSHSDVTIGSSSIHTINYLSTGIDEVPKCADMSFDMCESPIAVAAAGTAVELNHISARSKGMSLGSIRSRRLTDEVGIGAGAKIAQKFTGDNHKIKDWNEKPAGIIRLYFVFREQFERYVEDGLNDLTGTKEGYLNEIPVGGVK